MSTKKIAAGDTLTVGDLTDDYLGAEIEVGPMTGIAYRFTFDMVADPWSSRRELWAPKAHVGNFYPSTPVKVITPPPVTQPDEPKILGQCIRIEGDDSWYAVVTDPEGPSRICVMGTVWRNWADLTAFAAERRLIVSDPPRWPDETPDVPERIEEGEWPDDDTHLREWEWIDRNDVPWQWFEAYNRRRSGWGTKFGASGFGSPLAGPWVRGERVE